MRTSPTALAAYILSLEENNLLAHDHPAIAWLRECINRTVADNFRQLGMAY